MVLCGRLLEGLPWTLSEVRMFWCQQVSTLTGHPYLRSPSHPLRMGRTSSAFCTEFGVKVL